MSWITVKFEAEKIGTWDMVEISEAFQLCLLSAKRLSAISGGVSLGVVGGAGVVKVAFLYEGEVFAVVDCPEHFPPEMQGSKSMSIRNSNGQLIKQAGDQGKHVYSALLDLCTEIVNRRVVARPS